MNWKLKAYVQRTVAKLPAWASFPLYYGIQRTVGTLRAPDPMGSLREGLRLIDAIEEAGGAVEGSVVLEVGTGQRIDIPIALWLCGAAEIVTIDVTAYLRLSLVQRDLEWMRAHREAVLALFGPHARRPLFQQRFAVLMRPETDAAGLLETAGIRYLHHDVRTLPFADGSVDYHVSNNVFEHVPPDELRAILREGARLVRRGGLLVHRVDFSDHFEEADRRISSVNFLRFSEREWERYAGNVYAYHNRLRIDEFRAVVAQAGLDVVECRAEVDPEALRALQAGLPLDSRFAGKPAEVNATDNAVVVMRPVPMPARATFAPGARAVPTNR